MSPHVYRLRPGHAPMPDAILLDALSGVEGWTAPFEAEWLRELARRAPGDVVEIGSWKGRSTIALGIGVTERGEGLVWAVDHHRGSAEHRARLGEVNTYPEFRTNIARAGLLTRVVPMVMESEEAARRIVLGSVGLLFVDGSHDYESVANDIARWTPSLRPEASVVFDDMAFPGVQQAIYDAAIGPSGRFRPVEITGKMLRCVFKV